MREKKTPAYTIYRVMSSTINGKTSPKKATIRWKYRQGANLKVPTLNAAAWILKGFYRDTHINLEKQFFP